MPDLSTPYLGLKLKHPLIPSSSPLFKHLDSALRLEDAGAVSLFNRFYQPNIDLETLNMVDSLHLSPPEEALPRIRWIAILRGQATMPLAATDGVHTYEEAMKLLLPAPTRCIWPPACSRMARNDWARSSPTWRTGWASTNTLQSSNSRAS